VAGGGAIGPRPVRRRAAALALPVLLAVLIVGLLRVLPPGGLRYVDIPVLVMPLPPAAPAPVSPSPQPPALTRLMAPEPPTEPLGLAAPAPRVSAPDACAEPCLAVTVTGLGLSSAATARALTLPAVVGLSFSPYAADLDGWRRKAAERGHEVLLDLPLQPLRFPTDDSGPLTLLLNASPEEQAAALERVLAGSDGTLAVVAAAGAFAREPARFAPVAAALEARGLGLVEVAGEHLRAAAAGGRSLAYAAATAPRSDEPGAVAVERALGAAEAEALRRGRAMAAVPPSPLGLDRLSAWIGTLGEKKMTLVPPGALLGPPVGEDEAMAR
jgi:polysaccharide deacetylase 2 family uncharacterized protein YibQ